MSTLQIFVPFLSVAGGPLAGRSFLVLVLLFVPLLSPGADDTINWTKYDNTIPAISDTTSTNGRIPLGNNTRGDDFYVWFPAVLKDDTPPIYKMWYTGHDGTNPRIYYATSSNGLNWTKLDNTVPANSDGTSTNGKIPLGTPGKGDSTQANYPSVLKDSSTYKMWYVGYDSATTNSAIYYATSSNGLEWTKYTNDIPANSDSNSTGGRIPLGSDGRGDDALVLGPFVLKDDAVPTYKMWYTGYDGANYRIYYATSSNGLEWTKLDNGIPANTDSGEASTNGKIPRGTSGDTRAYYPCVIKDGSTYKMWYTGQDAPGKNRIYHATSSNGLEWTKLDNTVPPVSDTTNSNSRIGLGSDGRGDDFNAYSPSVLKDGSTYKMWYGGYDGVAAGYRIYHATYQIPPPAGTIFTLR